MLDYYILKVTECREGRKEGRKEGKDICVVTTRDELANVTEKYRTNKKGKKERTNELMNERIKKRSD